MQETSKTDLAPTDAILAVAADLFAKKGYTAASVREIAEGARVSKPTIYYYFQSKEGLLERLLERGFTPLNDNLRSINARPDEASAEECLRDTVWAFFEFAGAQPDTLRFLHTLAFGAPEHPGREAVLKWFVRIGEQFRKTFDRAARQGLIDPARIEAAVMSLRGTTTFYVVSHLQLRTPLSKRLAAVVVEGCLRGYGRQPGSFGSAK